MQLKGDVGKLDEFKMERIKFVEGDHGETHIKIGPEPFFNLFYYRGKWIVSYKRPKGGYACTELRAFIESIFFYTMQKETLMKNLRSSEQSG